jgi:hypothetical protein
MIPCAHETHATNPNLVFRRRQNLESDSASAESCADAFETLSWGLRPQGVSKYLAKDVSTRPVRVVEAASAEDLRHRAGGSANASGEAACDAS